uniref:C3H1-type domain-containing protein n=1 Tax=Rhabditophanes sp. KR3021 TaxID=114890 RepID=A0AC35TRX2_9BILA
MFCNTESDFLRQSSTSTIPTRPQSSLSTGSGSNDSGFFASFYGSNSIELPSAAKVGPKVDSYKTVMCQAWLENKTCSFGENCRFAHGESELKPIKSTQRFNNKYRTKLCDRYTNGGICPYGDRCLFIHPNANGSAYFSHEKIQEITSKGSIPKLDSSSLNSSTGYQSLLPTMTEKQHEMLFKNISRVPPTSWPLERQNVDPFSKLNLAGFDYNMLCEGTPNLFAQTLGTEKSSVDGLSPAEMSLLNASSYAWRNLMYSTLKSNEVESPALKTPKFGQTPSYFSSKDLNAEEPSLDHGHVSNDHYERQMAMFLGL